LYHFLEMLRNLHWASGTGSCMRLRASGARCSPGVVRRVARAGQRPTSKQQWKRKLDGRAVPLCGGGCQSTSVPRTGFGDPVQAPTYRRGLRWLPTVAAIRASPASSDEGKLPGTARTRRPATGCIFTGCIFRTVSGPSHTPDSAADPHPPPSIQAVAPSGHTSPSGRPSRAPAA
jgi:hypothetical protein